MAMHLKDLLPTLINPNNNWKTRLLYEWPTIIGSLHSKVRIEQINDTHLILGVSHPCWMQELYLLSPLLIKTINEKLDQPYIKQIRFRQVRAKNYTLKTMNTQTQSNLKKEVFLTKDDEKSLAKIADPALREALKAFRMRCYQE